MVKKTTWILFVIVLLGFILRFYKLGTVPTGFHRDEAFLGYNAYSLLKTGKDMTGTFLPMHFESFIYSPGGYSYFAIVPIAIFGLNEFSVRFPSAFFGSFTIVIAFLLTKKLFPTSTIIGLLTSFFLTITPWHINLSRTATENTLVVFFLSLGIYFFLGWIDRSRPLWIGMSFLSFILTLTLYQAPRAFLPLFIPVLIATFMSRYKKKKILLSLLLYFFMILIPVITILLTPTLATRMKTVGIWGSNETKLITEEQIREDGVRSIPPLLSRIVHNKFIGYSETFLTNYFSHLTFTFLFTDSGLPERYRVPNSGLLYVSMLPLITAGLLYLLSKHKKRGVFLIIWVLITFIGSALTFDDVPNMQRTLFVFPALTIITSFGWYAIWKSGRAAQTFCLLLLSLLMFEGYRYIHHYYVQQVVHRPWYRHEGYKELVKEVEQRKQSYKQIVVTNRESAPAIFFLFFTQYDPEEFQKETKNSTFRDFDRIHFANYIFSEEECALSEKKIINQVQCRSEKETLYVNSGLCKLPEVCGNLLHTVKRNDGTTVFNILEQSDAAATLSAYLSIQNSVSL